MYDGSGLSRRNRVSTATVLALIQHAAGPGGEAMRSLVTGMPVAGFTGSLTYRFADGPALARGLVRAKTGTLTGVHALAGIAVGRDGAPMAFVLAADKVAADEKVDAQDALDRAAGALAACRCSAPARASLAGPGFARVAPSQAQARACSTSRPRRHSPG